jgi:ribosomal protein S12 methylthiotransferase accessory factor
MKAFIPELAPPFPPSTPLLGHPRYYELPRTLGLTDRRLTFADLNTDPLPYP